jgi:hypothetical protein
MDFTKDILPKNYDDGTGSITTIEKGYGGNPGFEVK